MESWLLIVKLSWLGTAVALVAFYGRWWIGVAFGVLVGAIVIAATRSEVASIIPTDKSGLGAMGAALLGGFMVMAVAVGAFAGLLLRPVRDYLWTRLNQYPPRYPRTFILAAILAPATAISAAAVYEFHWPPPWGCVRNGVPITIGDLTLSPPPLNKLALENCRADRQRCRTWLQIDDGSDKRKFCAIDDNFMREFKINSVHYSAYLSNDGRDVWRVRYLRLIGDTSDEDMMAFLEGRHKPHVIINLTNPHGSTDSLVCPGSRFRSLMNCNLTYRLKGRSAAIAWIYSKPRVSLESSKEEIYSEMDYLLGRLNVER